jgi:4-hydroxy-2-oxoglutarate aldolase
MNRGKVVECLKGVICPVITPFKRSGGVDEGHFRENLQRLSAIGLAGILVAGSTGEAPYLTERERLRLVELARKTVKWPEILMVGTGLEGTAATIDLSREVEARGADALLVLTPNYFKPSMGAEALVAHYRKVAAGVRSPVMIYSIPQFTGLFVEPATISKLSRLPNVVGLKESSGRLDFVKAVLRQVKRGFRVMVGAPSIFYDSLGEGAVGGVLGVANYAPKLCVELYQAFLRRDLDAARAAQQCLAPLGQKINAPYGVAGVKAALDLLGWHGGIPRPPMLPVSSQARKEIAGVLREAGAGLGV